MYCGKFNFFLEMVEREEIIIFKLFINLDLLSYN